MSGGEFWLGYPARFGWDSDCTGVNEWCRYADPHDHGFACDETCPCRVDQQRWSA